LKVCNIFFGESKRFVLVTSTGEPVLPVMKYLKYLDSIGKAENTLKSYCYHLKLYFEFLDKHQLNYENIDINLLATFIGWLRSPTGSVNTLHLHATNSKRSENTINTIITCVISFYDYLIRLEQFESNINENVKVQITSRFRDFKPFLHHITKSMKIDKNILKLKAPKRKIRTLSSEQIQLIYNCCANIRDRFLIRLLYEGGLRISEALSLWIEDFDINGNTITVRKSKTRSGENRKVFLSEEVMNLFQEYLIDFHLSEFDTNFVFINLTGKNKGQPLSYATINSLIKRLKNKTRINFTPHMLRHTFATELHSKGTDVAIIQRLLGHAHVQTTIQTYLHPSDEELRKNWERAKGANIRAREFSPNNTDIGTE